MTMLRTLTVGSAGLAMLATTAPAVAQYGDPYGNSGYGNGGNVVGQVIEGLLGGGRYGAYGRGNDRIAVDQCARAAEVRANSNGQRPYGNAYGYYGNQGQRTKCNKNGKCTVTYYDSRYDRDDRRYRYNNARYERHDRYWDGRRWRDRDD